MNNSNDLSHSSQDMKLLLKQIQFLREEKLLEDREWLIFAACRDSTESFFPEDLGDSNPKRHSPTTVRHQREKAKKALEICARCPVIEECEIDHKHELSGIFYGTVPAERTRNSKRKPCVCLACGQLKYNRARRYSSHAFY